MSYITCSTCGRSLPADCFKSQQKEGSTRNPRAVGRKCVDCLRLWFRDNARRKRLEAGVIQRYSPKKIAESKDRKRLRDVTRFARWAKNNAEHVKILRRESSLRFAEKNPHKVRATLAKRRAAKLLATPKFGQDGIEDVYLEAHYFQMEVDHIIPLVSDKVCGLHVIANLQLLSKSANSAKRNRFDPNDDYFLQ